jgi:F-type H+-transporting ATPase subunit b
MPQLDMSTWPPQLFWLAISFGLLYFVVSRIIIPRTGGMIIERKNTIDTDLAAATTAKTDSEAALKAYEVSLAEARSKASAVGVELRTKLSAESDAARHKLDAELAAKAAEAEKAIQLSKQDALGRLPAIAEDIASAIVAQLSGAKVTKADVADAVSKVSR